jgi:hypothetical protein
VIDKSKLENTVLDDNAEIYKPRKEQTEKEKLSEMTFKEKVAYFNNYYRTKVIVSIVVIALVVYFIYSVVSPKPETVLYAAMINSGLDTETVSDLENDFGNKLGIDSEKQNIVFDTSFYFGNDSTASEYTMSSQEKLTAFLYAGQVDVLIAPESVFANYAKNGYFSKLSDELPTDLLTDLTDSIYYSTTNEDSDSGAYGIYMDKSKIYSEQGEMTDRPILGIVVNSKYKQNGVELIRYLLDMK